LGVPNRRIRRWLSGYGFEASTGRRFSPPIWEAQVRKMDRSVALGFLDLMEIRFVDRFRDLGVSWRVIRKVAYKAKSELGQSHAFCSLRFKTDGRAIFRQVLDAEGEKRLIEFLTDQSHFTQIIEPFLIDVDLQEKDKLPARWWPMGKTGEIVLDPRRTFGKPIVAKSGIPTAVLAQAARVEGSPIRVANWFGIDISAVEQAIKFEDSRETAGAAA
jgi:uncharacterized protein (DUF433 family)